jgi:hypothetical protein
LLQPEFRGYRLAPSYVEKGPFRTGAPLRIGAIVGGLRMRTDGTGLSLADTVAQFPLTGGAQVPEQLGGGLLFWSDASLYTADAFLATLKPLLDLGFTPRAVSFGPDFALVHGIGGARMAIDLRTRQRVPIAEPLLVDVASSSDGRVLTLLEGGTCAVSLDAGKTYQPLGLPTAEHALSLLVDADTLGAQLSSGSAVRWEKGGKPELVAARPAAPKRPRADGLWPLAEPPLERALRFGVPIGDEFAGVAVAGAVATVNLRTGELVQVTRALVPSDVDCRTLDANGTLLLACSSDSGSIVFSDVFGESPITQAKFPARVELAFGDGVLLAASHCDGREAPGTVCVREADGHFHDYDVSAALAALAPAAATGAGPQVSVSHWIPKQGGGALALVTGSVFGLLDAQSARFTPFVPGTPYGLLNAPRGEHDWLRLDWIGLHEGGMRGWDPGRHTSLVVAADGRIEPTGYAFQSVIPAGARAFAFDNGRHAFQTSDWGKTWIETLAPPGSALADLRKVEWNCSPVGCQLGPWLRVGWLPGVPGSLTRAQIVAAPARPPPADLPSLTCRELAPAVLAEAGFDGDPAQTLNFGVSEPPVTDGMYRTGFIWSTVRPILGPDFPVGLRAGLLARRPELGSEGELSRSGYAQSIPYAFVSAFDPSGRVRRASTTWRARFDAAASTSSEPPDLDPDPYGLSPALPVMTRAAGQTDGLILDDGSPVWVQESGVATACSFGPRPRGTAILSALTVAPRTLTLLVSGDEGTTEVMQVGPAGRHRLFSLPALAPTLYPENPDALALGPGGALGVLRTRSGAEPASQAEPMLLLDEHGAITPLAPWSRLFLAAAPECKPAPNDYRALLQTSRPWLALVDDLADGAERFGMFALIRVNPDRVCLEAVELAEGQDTYGLHLAARFVGNARGAARLAFGPGRELRQRLACSLSASH